jgi:hypothetical protein
MREKSRAPRSEARRFALGRVALVRRTGLGEVGPRFSGLSLRSFILSADSEAARVDGRLLREERRQTGTKRRKRC